MNFLEQELRKIVGPVCPDATFLPRACYVELSDLNRAKIQFDNRAHADQYNGITVIVLNQKIGRLDEVQVPFKDVWGTKEVNHLACPNGVAPHIWNFKNQLQWYFYQPTEADYSKLQRYLLDYLKVFDYHKDRKLSLDAQIAGSAKKAEMSGRSSDNVTHMHAYERK